MATNYKVLGQLNPAATTAADIYTVPADTQTIISTMTIANISASAKTYRISIRPNGAGQENKHYIAYDASVAANDTIALTLGVTLDASDVVTVYASSADLSFNIFGAEIEV